jgi:hypothetical protein
MNKSITFDPPVNLGGRLVSSLEMRAPTIGDEEDAMSMAVDGGRGDVTLTGEICLFALLCGVLYEDLRTLRSADYAKIRKTYWELALARPTEAPAAAGEGSPSAPAPGTPEPLPAPTGE